MTFEMIASSQYSVTAWFYDPVILRLHLPWAPYDFNICPQFSYVFFSGIVGGYGIYMYVNILNR